MNLINAPQCWPSRGSTRGGSQGMYITFASAMSIRQNPLWLWNPEDTRNPKQGYQWPQNRTSECVWHKKLQKKDGPGNLTSAGNSVGTGWLRAGHQEVGKCSTRGGSRGTYITFASAMQIRQPTLALKPRGDVTRNPKQGYQWPQNRTCECVRHKNLKKKKMGLYWKTWLWVKLFH